MAIDMVIQGMFHIGENGLHGASHGWIMESEVPTFSLPTPENCGEFIISAAGSAVIASAVWKIMEHHHLVGGFKHEFYFPFHILYRMSSFPLTNSYFS